MRYLPLLLAAAAASGCATSATSNTSRTAMEQLLIANAVDQSLDKVDFSAFAGRTVYLNDKYVDCTDKNYVIASVRHRILAQGARLVDDAEKAEVAVELRTGSVGTDMTESFFGTPEIVLPGMMTIPEVKLITRNVQSATAKIGLVAVNNSTKEVLGSGGMTTSVSDNTETKVLGVNLGTAGTLKRELADAGARRPVPPKLPARVAFAAPLPSADSIQFASEQPETPHVTPVSHSQPAKPLGGRPAAGAAGTTIDWTGFGE